MVQNRAFAAYNNGKVMTASPAELTLMLYDGAVKFANMAIKSMENGDDIETVHTYIMKVERIIIELKTSLDHKYEVSKEFDSIYDYLIRRLRDANLHKDVEIMKEVIVHLRTLRDMWKEVMEKTANGNHTKEVKPNTGATANAAV